MNPIYSIAANPYVATSLCLAGGYVLNKVSLAINQIAAKRFGLPIDLMQGKEYSDYVAHNKQEAESKLTSIASQCNLDLNVLLEKAQGSALCILTAVAIQEEFTYRHLLESVILPAIFPQFAAFSLARTCVSSLYFAAAHLSNPLPEEVLAGQFCNTFVLGIVCSIAKEKFGLLASIFTHIGFNLHGWQWGTNYNFSDTISKLKVLSLSDVIGSIAFAIFSSTSFVAPLHLTYKAIEKVADTVIRAGTPTNLAPA